VKQDMAMIMLRPTSPFFVAANDEYANNIHWVKSIYNKRARGAAPKIERVS
jgi:hypothetical protein